jgi:class 3 adenylate cyclase/tetratricopeptide (TPR) repeat protein
MATCGSCGRENPADARFCNSCGAPVAETSLSREQRKVVTVLFCDVTGSTELGERLDPEALRSLLARYFEAMRGIVERHGGSVEKFIGDAVMAVFGVPLVHEDDALRACRAALEMRQAFAGLGVEGRIGVSTGEVVTGTEERLATGDALNVAARLQQAALPGEVLIAQATRALVGDAVDVEPVEPLVLKGKSEPVPAHRLFGARAAPERRHDTVFVGREGELALVAEAWGRALAERRCELVTVIGEAGVGKSRLVAEALASIETRVVRGRCLPYGVGITYWPVVEVVKQLGALPSDPGAAAAIRSALGESDEGTSAEEIAWAFRKLLEERAPLAVVFDDVQWGEETFLDLVEHVALLSGGAPLLLVSMARPELLDIRPSWPVSVRLEPLSGEDAASLIGTGVPEELRVKIADAAGGNPLFIGEMLAMTQEAGSEVEVPPTLKALLAARLDQLDTGERRVLERGAVEGEVFHRGAVQALAREEPQVTPRLAALVRRDLIRPERAEFAGENGFRFRHLLVRDAAYDALPKAIRAELHERYAGWLEQMTGDGTPGYEEIVGYHFEQAYLYRTELGLVDDASRALARQAAERLGSAGHRAFVRGDVAAAVNLISRAVPLLPADDPSRVGLVPNVRVVQGLSGDLSWADRVLTEAVAAAVASGDRQVEAHALVQRGLLRLFTQPDVAAQELIGVAEHAIAVFDEFGDELGLARAWRLVAQAHYLARHGGPSAEASERALEHGRLAGDLLELREIVEWFCVAMMLGPMPALDVVTRCEALLADARRDPILEPTVLGVLANAQAMQGRIEKAEELVARWRVAVAELGDSIWLFAIHLGFIWLADDPVAAERELRPGYEALKRIGEKSHFSSVSGLLARAVCAQGRYDEADRISRESEEAARPNDIHAHILWRTARAQALAERGELETAEKLAREAVAFAAESDFLDSHGDALLELAEVMRLTGRPKEAVGVVREAERLFTLKGNVVSAARAHARLA